jgi:hypothetical protein
MKTRRSHLKQPELSGLAQPTSTKPGVHSNKQKPQLHATQKVIGATDYNEYFDAEEDLGMGDLPPRARIGELMRRRRQPQPTDPEWYGRPARTNKCKNCQRLRIGSCALKETGFPCRNCVPSDTLCEEGNGRNPGRPKGRMGKQKGDISNTKQGRGSNLNMGKERRRSASPMGDGTPGFMQCSNCNRNRTFCTGGHPCQQCRSLGLEFSCRPVADWGNEDTKFESDNNMSTGDTEFDLAVSQSRDEHNRQQRRFGRYVDCNHLS